MRLLCDAGVAAVEVLGRDDVFTAPALEENDFYVTVEDHDLGPIRAVRGFSRWAGAAPAEVLPTRALGADNETVQRSGWAELTADGPPASVRG